MVRCYSTTLRTDLIAFDACPLQFTSGHVGQNHNLLLVYYSPPDPLTFHTCNREAHEMAYNDSRLSLEAATERTDTIFIRQPRAWPTFESEEQTSPPTFPDRSPALGESSLSPTSTLADGKDSSRFYPGFTRLDEQMDEALLGNHVKSKYYATYANPDIFFSATVKGHGVAG